MSNKKAIVSFLIFALTLIGCKNKNDIITLPFNTRLKEGDNFVGRSLNYFESWKSSRQPKYLILAETNTISAIISFSKLESEISPRIIEFYVARERRTKACKLLAEVKYEANNHGLDLNGIIPFGCIY